MRHTITPTARVALMLVAYARQVHQQRDAAGYGLLLALASLSALALCMFAAILMGGV